MVAEKKLLPPRTVERFFLYSRFLKAKQDMGAENVFSHELSLAVGISPEQVRQDLRLLNISGTPQRGYQIGPFLADLRGCLSMEVPVNAVLAGVGNLGRALLRHFAESRPNLRIVAAFDADPEKHGREYAGCPVYPAALMDEIICLKKPLAGIIAVPPAGAQQLADDMAESGIKGILNFAPVVIKPPKGVYLEQVDVLMALEKTAFFARNMY